MKKKQLLLLALLLAILAVLLRIAWPTDDGGDGDGTDDVAAVVPHTPEEEAPDESTDLMEATTPESDAGRSEAVAEAGWKETAASGPGSVQSFDLEGAVWVDVSVVLPPNCAADPTLEIVVLYPTEFGDYDDEDHPWMARDVLERRDRAYFGGDCDFALVRVPASLEVRVPRPAVSSEGFFSMRGRYLRLDDERREFTAVGEPVVLAPVLGAWLTGRFVIPPEAQDRRLGHDSFHAEIVCWSREEDSDFLGGFEPASEELVLVHEDLTYEARGLSPDLVHTLSVSVDGLLEHDVDDIEVQPGEHKVLDVAFESGASILGRVTDEEGRGIFRAEIRVHNEDTESDEDGYYALHGLYEGTVNLRVTARGWLDAELPDVVVEGSGRIENCDFRLVRGPRIAGIVRMPSGASVEGAYVHVYERDDDSLLNQVGWAESDEEGHFEITALLGGPFEVLAGFTASWQEVPATADSGSRDPHPRYWAAASEVAPDTIDLMLVLEESFLVLAVRVVDDTGAPVESFEIGVRPCLAGGLPRAEPPDEIEAPDGKFRLPGLFAGEWEVTVAAVGFSNLEEPVIVTLPQGDTPLMFTLHRTTTVTGTVVDPAGNPVADASVRARRGGALLEPVPFFRDTQETDAAGRFTIERADLPGMLLVAWHEEWAPSEETPIVVAAGERMEEVVLRLRTGGRITGEVLDEAGKPLQGRIVTVSIGMSGVSAVPGVGERETTDAAGHFAFDHVTPGEVTVMAGSSEEEIEAATEEAGGDDEIAMISLVSQLRTETVEVKDGEEVHVIFRSEPKSPVRVHGRVTEAGVLRTQGMVIAIAEGSAFLSGMRMARIDGRGGYELTVDRPGDYVFSVGDEDLEDMVVTDYVEVPEAEAFAFDIAVPSGRITGRVFDADGDPASGVMVYLSKEDGIRGIGDVDPGGRRTTAEDGSYAIENLAPGTYSVHVTELEVFMNRMQGRGGGRYGCVVVSGIRVGENETAGEVDVRLPRAGALRGAVRDAAGRPVAGATIFVRDGTGRLVSNFSSLVSDALGKYEHGSLAPGPVTVSAQKGELTCADRGPVTITEGGIAECDLRLSPGVFLEISLLEDGDSVHVRLRVLDEAGRQVNGRFSLDSLQELFTEGISSKERTVGPVPPGEYRVIATTEDGKEAKKTVRVREGQSTRRIKLRLK